MVALTAAEEVAMSPSDEVLPQLNIRGVRRQVWQRFRIEAFKRNLELGPLLNQALTEWMAEHETSDAALAATAT